MAALPRYPTIELMNAQPQNAEIVLFRDHDKNKPQELPREEPLVMMKKSSKQTLVQASHASQEIFRIKGRFPFDLYPDELIVEEKRLILKRNFFPWVSQITTVPIAKLVSFEVTHSIFFSSIFIKWGYASSDTTFQWLTHKDAQKAKEIMDGIRLRDNESIQVLEQDKNNLSRTFQVLGQM